MLSLIALVVASVFASVAVAQAPNATYSPTIINQITTEVDLTTRNSWCNSQHSTCGMLCGGTTDSNSCDGPTLNYNCTCASNHSAPANEFYIGTIPTFVCNRAKGDCMALHAGDITGQQRCNTTFICGSANASMASVAPSTSSSAPASTATGSMTGTASAPASTTAKSAAIRIGQEYGLGLLVLAMGAAFSFAL